MFCKHFFKSCVCESIVFFFFWNSMDRVDFSSSCCQGILQEQGNRILAYMSENGSLFFIHILLLLYVILLTIGRQHNLLTCNFFSLMCTGFAVFNKHQWIFFMLASLMHLRDVRHCWYRSYQFNWSYHFEWTFMLCKKKKKSCLLKQPVQGRNSTGLFWVSGWLLQVWVWTVCKKGSSFYAVWPPGHF